MKLYWAKVWTIIILWERSFVRTLGTSSVWNTLRFFSCEGDGDQENVTPDLLIMNVRSLPHCALDRLSGFQTGWPLRSVPLQHCSGPELVGWCSLGHWCCLCVSLQTGSPPGRLEKKQHSLQCSFWDFSELLLYSPKQNWFTVLTPCGISFQVWSWKHDAGV